DRAVAREEDDVDRKPHEEHVHRAGAIDQHSCTGLERVASEQPARSAEGALRRLALLADDLARLGEDSDHYASPTTAQICATPCSSVVFACHPRSRPAREG